MKTKLSIITLALLPCLAAAKLPDAGVKHPVVASSDAVIVKYKKNASAQMRKQARSLVKAKISDVNADEIDDNLGDIIDSGLKYSINHKHLDSDAFFSVDSIGGALFITLNRKHSAYKELFDTLGKDVSKSTPQEMEQYLLRANSALMVMLIAWSRLEDESSGSNKIRLQDTRKDWGRIARDFLLFGRE